ncbi:BRCA2, oligonucleotide/oligosaccharide-binding domain 1 protein (macronuclear) [Tetrahymena thermophila SB210]|uniref:BRCA2, oligonucleotide/oligosaccharide-binding domain 1 protein n=1 Tax=Tetrahymena thermophila (strain SB210) TaxID=312017 RepID=I7MK26_TETTS|nr:BRCA2, oligonucleotide/oligosaccharide-binding domain 1 protein [Tetrahymena thermophila SB210]EAR97477.1 BRCA2, oligonucleotide/oligosaccharide-binding domain 1 protein [Tetrahymena thermophila SB210]|eukprot:XP_001017722.1 BRCA2, oligonucleotide/oligosaccharide-binding domain 1 protein [Tetrahymena thermophila SB210]
MFLASTPPKQTQKATVNDYFDSESDCSNHKNNDNALIEKNLIQSYSVESQSNLIGNRYNNINQIEIEKLRGQNSVSQQVIAEKLQQKDFFKFQYFSSEKKQLSPDDQDQSDEEDLQQSKKNSHIFTNKSVLAEKKQEFNNQTDIIRNDFNIDRNISIQGEKELKQQNNNQQSAQNNHLAYQLNSSLIPFAAESEKIRQNQANSQENNQSIKINNIFNQQKQQSIDNNQINSINHLQININNIPLKQQSEEKGIVNITQEGQMIKTQSLLNLVENQKMLIEVKPHLKDFDHQNFDDNILAEEIEIEIDNSNYDRQSISDDEFSQHNQKSNTNVQFQESKSIFKDEEQNGMQISLSEKCRIIDQSSNQSRIGFLNLNNSENSNQQLTYFNNLQESSSESENSRNSFIKRAQQIFNQNNNTKQQPSQVNKSTIDTNNNNYDNGLPDPFQNEKFFQKKKNDLQFQDQAQFSFAKVKKNEGKIAQTNGAILIDQNKRKNLFQNEQINFSVPQKQNQNFQKFTIQFEEFDESSQENSSIQQNQTEKGQKIIEDPSFKNFSIKQELQSNKGTFEKPQLPKKNNQISEHQLKIEQERKKNQPNILQDNFVNGFKISQKVQKNDKFSKFVGLFEDINDEDEYDEQFNNQQSIPDIQIVKQNSFDEGSIALNKTKQQCVVQNDQIGFNFTKPTFSNGFTNSFQSSRVGLDVVNTENQQVNKQQETKNKTNVLHDTFVSGFNISSKIQKDEKFSKFVGLFEDMNDEEDEQDEFLNNKSELEGQVAQINSQNNFNQQIQQNEDIGFTFKKQNSNSNVNFKNTFQSAKVNFEKPSIKNKEDSENLYVKQQQETKNKSNILQDQFVNGFKISSKVQKDEKFSKFVGLFEDMNDEEAEQDSFQEEFNNKKSELEGQAVVQKSSEDSKVEFQSFKSAKVTTNVEFGFTKPKSVQNDQKMLNGFNKANQNIIPTLKEKSNLKNLLEELNQEDGDAQDQYSTNNYDEFFNKQKNENQEEFIGFKTAKNNRKLEVDEKVIEQLTKIFDKNDKNVQQPPQQNQIKEDNKKKEQKSQDYNDFFNTAGDNNNGFFGFKTAKSNKKLEVDEKILKQLTKIYEEDDKKHEKKISPKQNKIDTEEQTNYDDFFSNKTSSDAGGFFGFKTANNKKNLEVNEKLLEQISKHFDSDDTKEQKNANSKIEKQYSDNDEFDDSKKYEDFFSNKSDASFGGFKIAKGNKEIKVDPSKLMQFEQSFSLKDNDSNFSKSSVQGSRVPKRKMNIDDDEEHQQQQLQKEFGNKMLKVDQQNKIKPISGSGMKDSYSFSNGFKNTPQTKSDNKDRFNSNSRFQNSESSFNSGFQKSSKSDVIQEDDGDDDDAFSRFIRQIKKPEPKRSHPKPFRQVKVVDSSKTTPIAKETPNIKSTKIERKANYKRGLLNSEESANSFLFAKDSVEKSGQKSGKSSTLSKKFKPQSIERINESISKDQAKKSKDTLKQGNRYSFIDEEDEDGNTSYKRQLFNSSSKKSNLSSSMKQIQIALNHQYLNNPLIQMKYNYDSQIANSNFIRYDELKPKKNQMEIENDNQTGIIQNMAKDINQCLYYSTMCNCLRNNLDNLLNFQENSFTQRIECFCSLPIPSTEPVEEENAPKKTKEADDVLEYNKNKLQKGFLNYLNFFAKLQQKEKTLEEKWVRNHFRQVVWKLSCYENNLDYCPVNKKLTVENIYYELEYRLYSEVYACKRSILKQIQEQDAVKSLNMVLIVANITKVNQYGCYVLELSDGWYSFFVVVLDHKHVISNDLYQQNNKILQLDLIKRNKIYIGMKMYVNNLAKPSVGNLENMINPKQNILYQNVYEIFYNNIIKAPANSKLGICSNALQKYFPRSLKSIKPCGGDTIQSVDVFIVKKYPLCYEAGNVKVSFCNPKQMEDEGMDGGKQLGFTVLVVDSLSYYDETFKIDEQPWVYINIHSVTHDLYDSLKEGTRIRLYNLKINNRGQQKMKFNYKYQKIVKEILYLETNKKTKIEEMSTFIKAKEDQQSMKKFGLELTENFKFLLEDVQESIFNLQYDKALQESFLQQYKVEMDVIMYIVKIEDGSYFGINQNYSAICISPTNEIRQSTNSVFKKQKPDDEYSLEDAHLYDKLSKNREIKTANQISEKSNQIKPKLQNPEEGKIGVFLNVQLNTIKQSTLSTSNLEKYHFNFTFNTYKKTYSVDNLNAQTLPYSDKYKKQINELNEFLGISSDKFLEVSNYLRNYI